MKATSAVHRSSGMRGSHGLTLLELLIALAVIAIAFWAIASAQIGSLSSTAKAREISEARTFANRVLEERRKIVMTEVLNTGTTIAAQQAEWNKYAGGTCPVPTLPSTADALCKGSKTEGIYTAQWALGPESADPEDIESEGLIQILLRVDWTKGGATRSLSFMDYINCGHIDLDVCPVPFDPDP